MLRLAEYFESCGAEVAVRVVGDPVVVVLSDWGGEEVASKLGEGWPR